MEGDERELSAEELMDKKEAIETEIETCNTVLETVRPKQPPLYPLNLISLSLQQGGVGMSGSLVDSEGFPRSDIDIYAIRTARNRIIC